MYERARKRTENRILEATIAILVRDGYEKMTVTAIAERADVGRGTFYHYFAGVDDALLTIGRRAFEQVEVETHALMGQLESPEREQRAWETAFETVVDLKPLLLALTHPQAADLQRRFQQVMIDGYTVSLASGAFRYPHWMQLPHDVMATFAAGAILALMQRWVAGELPYSSREMGQMVYRLLYHAPATDAAQHEANTAIRAQ